MIDKIKNNAIDNEKLLVNKNMKTKIKTACFTTVILGNLMYLVISAFFPVFTKTKKTNPLPDVLVFCG